MKEVQEALKIVIPPYIKDIDCTKDTPVVWAAADKIKQVYGKGKQIEPFVHGRTDTNHFRDIYLDKLLPLENYDLIIVLFSGGKDSLASYLYLRELGVPAKKIELWHHDIDGGNPIRRMDWKCTQNYVKAFSEAQNIPLRVSYRINGFFGELYRLGASEPIEWMDPDTGEVFRCKESKRYIDCLEIKQSACSNMEELLKPYGYRYKFPAKTGDLSRRWCSAYLKIMVCDSLMSNLDNLDILEKIGGKRHKFPAKGTTHQGRWCSGALKAAVQDSVTSNLEKTKENIKILVVSGERRGESTGRSAYNEIEIHRTNAVKKNKRLVHQWRPVLNWSEKDVWEIIKRHHIRPHPCYSCGWNRCSCACCIFSTPQHFAGIKELYPNEWEALKKDEEVLGFTLDNKCDLESFIKNTDSCVYHGDKKALKSLITGDFSTNDIYQSDWKYPAGAFHGAEGGPC
ncbi:MAG: phosphoadenosine phosphosulfate reductase family protein [Lachnospiraceae bacterium]|nr:phosphoadenosine phosphosulfate reductase family protein [Lachnospiraceae bacterium]